MGAEIPELAALHLDALSDADLAALTDAVVRVVRDLGDSVPKARGAPFFGLDLACRDPRLLDAFCEQGIFRKYQRAAALECGLGGAVRWWSVRFGCRVVGFDRRRRLAASAAELSRRAGLDWTTCFAAAPPDVLPAADRSFTHVWQVTERPLEASPLHEAFRILRPGGELAVQLPSALLGDSARWRQELGMIGFEAVEMRCVETGELAPSFLLAWTKLEDFLADGESGSPALRDWVASRRSSAGAGGIYHYVFARRPA